LSFFVGYVYIKLLYSRTCLAFGMKSFKVCNYLL